MSGVGLPVEEIRTLSELEQLASRRVSDSVWEYIQGGSGDERSLRANVAAFRRWTLRPRVLVDVSAIDLRFRALGRDLSVPFFVSPMAYQGQVDPEGERAVARACAAANALAVYSTVASFSLEQIAEAAPGGARWFQLYLQPDFAVSRALVERAERAGYSAIVLTVDVPVLAVRDRQVRKGFAISSSVPVGNGPDVVPTCRSPTRQGDLYRLRADGASTWRILEDLASITRLPIVVKGVLHPDDAELSVRHGARGVVVSNHGGRQLDGAPASLDALPEVVRAVGSRTEVYLDGGVRRASDVLIALALGAKAVGIGRPVLWALSVGGESGVRRYLTLLTLELATSMALSGRRSIAEIDSTLVAPTSSPT